MINSILKCFKIRLVRNHDPFLDFISFTGRKISMCFLDGGAYKGNVSKKILDLFPVAKVYAFEPQINFFHKLELRFKDQPRINLMNLALSDKKGQANFYINEQAYTSSLLTTKEVKIMKPEKEHAVTLTTIDDWCAENKVTFDFIKLDLQGHDLKGLHGAEKSLKQIKGVLIEAGFKYRYEDESLFHDISLYLYKNGFRLYRMYEIHGDTDGSWKHGDALFLKSHLLEKSAGDRD